MEGKEKGKEESVEGGRRDGKGKKRTKKKEGNKKRKEENTAKKWKGKLSNEINKNALKEKTLITKRRSTLMRFK